MKKIIIILFIFSFVGLAAKEKSHLELAKNFFENREYYHSISETLRYENYYPNGKYLHQMIYIRGISYYKGGDYQGAIASFTKSLVKSGASVWKERSHFSRGFIRLKSNNSFYAYIDFTSYLKHYPNGIYRDAAFLHRSYAMSLSSNLYDSLYQIRLFYKSFPSSKYMTSAKRLEEMIIFELMRPKKNMVFALLGSILLPGFGYFYTENYELGFLSLGSNALMITAIVLSALQGNIFAVILFSLLEVSLYTFQISGAIKSVNDYNSHESFFKKIRFEITFPL